MNNRGLVRKWAQQSFASFWISPLFVVIMYLLSRDWPESQVLLYLFSMAGSLYFTSVYNASCLAKEIVRLEEKIEELERRIP